MNTRIAAYNDNKKALDSLCQSVINDLASYKNVIRLPLIFNPETQSGYKVAHTLDNHQIDIGLDLKLIKALNKQLSGYLDGTTNVSSKYPSILSTNAALMYPSRSASNTFLDDVPGKILEFMYSMYQVISTHRGINLALTGIKRCGPSKEQYVILEQCKKFITQGNTLFRDEPEIIIQLLADLQIARLLALTYGKSQEEALNNVFNELDAYTFGVNTNAPISAPTSQKSKGLTHTIKSAIRTSKPVERTSITPEQVQLEPINMPLQTPPVPPRVPARPNQVATEYETRNRSRQPANETAEYDLGEDQIMQINGAPPSESIDEPAVEPAQESSWTSWLLPN